VVAFVVRWSIWAIYWCNHFNVLVKFQWTFRRLCWLKLFHEFKRLHRKRQGYQKRRVGSLQNKSFDSLQNKRFDSLQRGFVSLQRRLGSLQGKFGSLQKGFCYLQTNQILFQEEILCKKISICFSINKLSSLQW